MDWHFRYNRDSISDYVGNGESILKKVVYLGVEPDGPFYGFPKRVPDELIMWYGKSDYGLSPKVRKWMSEEGYPAINGKNVRVWHEMRVEND